MEIFEPHRSKSVIHPSLEQDHAVGSIEFSLVCFLKPWFVDPDDYTVDILGTINLLLGEHESDEPTVAGEMRLVLFKLAEARRAKIDVFSIFDSHSDVLEGVYHDIFDRRGRLRRRHKIKATVDELLFVDTIKWTTGFGSPSLLARSVETAIAVNAPAGLVVGYADDLNQFGVDWKKYGFASAGRSGLLLRNNRDIKPEDLPLANPEEYL